MLFSGGFGNFVLLAISSVVTVVGSFGTIAVHATLTKNMNLEEMQDNRKGDENFFRGAYFILHAIEEAV